MEISRKQSSTLNRRINHRKNRDTLRFERKQRISKTTKGFMIAVGVISLILIIAGVIYTWYMGQNIDSSAIAEKMEPITNEVKQPAKPADNVPVGVALQMIESPISAGENTMVSIKTKPEAVCNILVEYDDIKSGDSGLIDKIADDYGVVSWSWTVENNVPVGKWPVTITCAQGEKSGMYIAELEIE